MFGAAYATPLCTKPVVVASGGFCGVICISGSGGPRFGLPGRLTIGFLFLSGSGGALCAAASTAPLCMQVDHRMCGFGNFILGS